MDPPPEGSQPEKLTEERVPMPEKRMPGQSPRDGAELNHAESSEPEQSDRASTNEPPDTPSSNRPDGSDHDQVRPPEMEVEVLDPTRTLIFHRFDPESIGARSPHFDAISHPDASDSDAVKTNCESEPDDVSFSLDHTSSQISSQIVRFDPTSPSDRDAVTEVTMDDVVTTRTDVDGDLEIDEPSDRTVARSRNRNYSRRSDPVLHGLVMLATVFILMAAARFILPSIIEEIRYAQHRGQLRAEFEVASEGLRDVSLDTLSTAYQMVNAAAGPSVVHIDIHRTAHQTISAPELPGAPSILISDQGSGVVVDADGYVLTNRHVIATSDQISVTLSDGRVVNGEVVGTDELTDLAVLKVDANNLIPIPWGDSERIRVGSPVWAIGSPFGLDRTVTFGILSGKHRVVRAKDRYQDFMQSDVAVNPGNSGGPLVDSRGTLIGINTAIVGETYQGVSFAIPSGVAKKIYLRLRETGEIQRGWLGVSLAEVQDAQLHGNNHRIRGAMIVALADQRSGAARAGLKAGDIVVKVDSEQVRDVDHLMQVIGNAMAGSEIKLSVVRDDQEMQFNVALGKRPRMLTRP